MLHRARGETAMDLIVEHPRVAALARRVGRAVVKRGVWVGGIDQRSRRIDDPEPRRAMLVAARSADVPVGVDLVRQDVGRGDLLALEVIAGLAEIGRGCELAAGVGQEGARRREHAVAAVLRIVRIGAEQRQLGRRIEVEAQRARHRLALARAERLLRMRAVDAAVDAPQHRIADLAADIGVGAVQVVAAVGPRHRTIERLVERQLARQRDEAARARLAVEHGGGALDHFDPVEPRDVDLGLEIACPADQLEPVEELRRVEPAQLELVIDFGARPALLGGDAGDEA